MLIISTQLDYRTPNHIWSFKCQLLDFFSLLEPCKNQSTPQSTQLLLLLCQLNCFQSQFYTLVFYFSHSFSLSSILFCSSEFLFLVFLQGKVYLRFFNSIFIFLYSISSSSASSNPPLLPHQSSCTKSSNSSILLSKYGVSII